MNKNKFIITNFKYYILLLICGMTLIWFGIAHLNHRDHLKNPDRVAFILNISKIPASVRNIDCSAWAITDLIVTCAFEIDPREFEQLLAGWNFDSMAVHGKGTSYAMDAPVGREFDATIRYTIEPESFEHGGLVNLVSNETRTLVVANRFEE